MYLYKHNGWIYWQGVEVICGRLKTCGVFLLTSPRNLWSWLDFVCEQAYVISSQAIFMKPYRITNYCYRKNLLDLRLTLLKVAKW